MGLKKTWKIESKLWKSEILGEAIIEDIGFSEYERLFYAKAIKDTTFWHIPRGSHVPEPVIPPLEKAYYDWFDLMIFEQVIMPRYQRAVRLLKALWKNHPDYKQPEEKIKSHFTYPKEKTHGLNPWDILLDCHDCHDEVQYMLDRANQRYLDQHFDIWGRSNPPTELIIEKLIQAGAIEIQSRQMRLL